MSSLDLRATWTKRAMSTWRSSTGGRPKARTTAAESRGSLSRRNQASTSRAAARSKKAPAASAPPGLSAGGANAILETATKQAYERLLEQASRAPARTNNDPKNRPAGALTLGA